MFVAIDPESGSMRQTGLTEELFRVSESGLGII